MAFLVAWVYVYLICAIIFYARKRQGYSHLKQTISELGESGSQYEKQVSYIIFLPVGIGCLVISYATYTSNYQAAFLSGALGLSYFLSAIFPCDPGTPLSGTWKNAIHNIVGAVCYVAMAYQLNELIDSNTTGFIDISLFLLCSFLLIFIIGFPKQVIGLAQRIAETSIFFSIGLLLVDISAA